MKLANHRGRAVLVVEDAIVGDEGDVGAADMGAVDIAQASDFVAALPWLDGLVAGHSLASFRELLEVIAHA